MRVSTLVDNTAVRVSDAAGAMVVGAQADCLIGSLYRRQSHSIRRAFRFRRRGRKVNLFKNP